MEKNKINEQQSVIKETRGDFVFRFTETELSGGQFYQVRLNEIGRINEDGRLDFLFSDETPLKVEMVFQDEAGAEDIHRMIDYLRESFQRLV